MRGFNAMKRIVLTTIIICMAALLAACGGTTDSQGSEDQSDQAALDEQAAQTEQETEMDTKQAKLLYMGHASIRITTPEDKVIYIDPFAGDGDDYAPAADLILETHGHYDHTALDKVVSPSMKLKRLNAGIMY